MSSSLYFEPAFARLPRAKVWRRGVASAIDFAAAALVSATLGATAAGSGVQFLVFAVVWFILRVAIVAKNQGQSPGHWALDMKVVDAKSAKVPGLIELARREGVLGAGALLILLGLTHLGWGPVVFLLAAPLTVDCSAAVTDRLRRQTLHDRLGKTVVVQTFRGYSLDRKIKRLLAQTRSGVK